MNKYKIVDEIVNKEIFNHTDYVKIANNQYRTVIEEYIINEIFEESKKLAFYKLISILGKLRKIESYNHLLLFLQKSKYTDQYLTVVVSDAIGNIFSEHLENISYLFYLSDLIKQIFKILDHNSEKEILSNIAWVLSNANKKFKTIDLMNQTKESLMKVLEDPIFNK